MKGERMDVSFCRSLGELASDNGIIATYFSDDELDQETLSQISSLDLPGFSSARERGELKGSLFRTALFHGEPALALIGLGKRRDFSEVRWRRAVQAGTRQIARAGYRNLAVLVPPYVDSKGGSRAAVASVVAGVYDPGIRKTRERESHTVDRVTIVTADDVSATELDQARLVAESANIARDLLNLPPADLNPVTFAERIEQIGREAGLAVQILDENQIADMGMGAILGVASGSSQPPRVVTIQYGDPSSSTKLTFVGKGLTYDSGGLSLKTHEGLEWMKGDMGGAAAVVGAMRAIGLLKPHGIFVRGIIGAVENMPGPAAMKPGDVLETMNGKTIEVLNTDAEGRLVLSDALAYAVQLGATHIVDLATLTGSAVVALGTEAAALVGRPQEWVDTVAAASQRALERTWQLPLFPEYRRQINSDVADMKNVGGREAGALTAAALLAEFVDDVPWAHLDIAGTAWIDKRVDYASTGGTGYGVATLVELAAGMVAP